MMLTSAQMDALAAHIRANTAPEVVEALAARADTLIANYYNSPSTFVVWKSILTRHEILTGRSDEGTVFTWAGAAYIGRTQGERDAFREMFNSTGSVVPTQPTIIAAFNDIFSGAGGASNRAHVNAISKRKATIAESVFATGMGTTATPGTLVVEGILAYNDISYALNA